MKFDIRISREQEVPGFDVEFALKVQLEEFCGKFGETGRRGMLKEVRMEKF